MFLGSISYDNADFWSFSGGPEDEQNYQKTTQKSHLDTMLKKKEVKEASAVWQHVVDTFEGN